MYIPHTKDVDPFRRGSCILVKCPGFCVCFSFNGAYRAVNRGIFFVLTVTVSENWDARCSLHLHKTFNIYTEFRKDDDRKISNRFSQTSIFVSPGFWWFCKGNSKKRWTKSWLPVSSGAPMQRSIVKANHPSPTMHGSRTKATESNFEGSFLLRGERLFLFPHLSGEGC